VFIDDRFFSRWLPNKFVRGSHHLDLDNNIRFKYDFFRPLVKYEIWSPLATPHGRNFWSLEAGHGHGRWTSPLWWGGMLPRLPWWVYNKIEIRRFRTEFFKNPAQKTLGAAVSNRNSYFKFYTNSLPARKWLSAHTRRHFRFHLAMAQKKSLCAKKISRVLKTFASGNY